MSSLSGTDNVEGDRIAQKRIQKIFKAGQMETSNRIDFKQALIVDHTNNLERIKIDFADSGINKALVISSDRFKNIPAVNINAMIRKMLIKHNAMSVTMGENKILKMDISDIDGFVKALDVFNAVANGQMLVDWKIFENALTENKITYKKMRELLTDAKRHGVMIHCEYKASEMTVDNDIKKLFDIGFQGVSLDLTALDKQKANQILDMFKGYPIIAAVTPNGVESPAPKVMVKLNEVKAMRFSSNEVIDVEIPKELNKSEIRENMVYLPLSNTIIFHSNDAAGLISATRDIIDKKAFASLFNILLNFGKAEITTPEKARRLGYNWDVSDLPELPSDRAGKKLIDELCEGKISELLTLNSELGGAIYEQVSELTTPELKTAFLSAIAEKMLIKERLLMGNKELANDYIKGKYKFQSPWYEEMLGSALLKQYRMISDELIQDKAASSILKANVQDNLNSFLIKLSDDIKEGQAQLGSITAVIEMILLDISSDYNIRKTIYKKQNGFDSRTVNMILGAA